MPIFDINNKKILFIHIPKTAGSFIAHCLNTVSKNKIVINNSVINLKYLFGQHKRYQLQHLTMKQIIDTTDFSIDDFDIIFTILRDPKKRFLSEINWSLNNYYFRKLKEDKNQSNNEYIEEKIQKYKCCKESDLTNCFNHDFPQYKFIEGFEDKIKIFTDLEQVKDFFLKELNIEININKKINKSNKIIECLPKKYDYNEIFDKDITLFNKYKNKNNP